MIKLIILLCLLFPTVAPAYDSSIIRDRSGSVMYTTDRYGNQVIYRDRSGSVIGTQDFESRRDRRDRNNNAPLAPLYQERED